MLAQPAVARAVALLTRLGVFEEVTGRANAASIAYEYQQGTGPLLRQANAGTAARFKSSGGPRRLSPSGQC